MPSRFGSALRGFAVGERREGFPGLSLGTGPKIRVKA